MLALILDYHTKFSEARNKDSTVIGSKRFWSSFLIILDLLKTHSLEAEVACAARNFLFISTTIRYFIWLFSYHSNWLFYWLLDRRDINKANYLIHINSTLYCTCNPFSTSFSTRVPSLLLLILVPTRLIFEIKLTSALSSTTGTTIVTPLSNSTTHAVISFALSDYFSVIINFNTLSQIVSTLLGSSPHPSTCLNFRSKEISISK